MIQCPKSEVIAQELQFFPSAILIILEPALTIIIYVTIVNYVVDISIINFVATYTVNWY